MYVVAFNTSTAPVTVDAEGRQIGGRGWGPVESTAQQVKDAVSAGRLVLQEFADDDGHPEAVAARDRTMLIRDRATALSNIDKELLAAAAADAGVRDADELHKDELVHALASRNIPIPAPEPEAASPEQPPAEAYTQPVHEEASPEHAAGEPTPETPPRKATSGRRAGRGTE